MRNKKIQGQTLFQVSELKQNGTLRSKDVKKSPKKKTSPRGRRKLSFPSKKPGLLFGKRFFLDLSGQGKLKSIQSKIHDLGGIFEEFVSKEVHYIITDRVSVEEVIASNKKGAQTLSFGPTPSPLQQISSNKCYGNSPMSTDSPQSLEVRTLNATRGNALLKNVATTQRQGSTNLLEIAKKWNVKVMHYDQFVNWSKDKISQSKRVEPKDEKQSSKSFQTSTSFKMKSLKSPFIKIEELNRKYRPFYLELNEWPTLHFDSAPGHCPFEKPKRRTEIVEPNDELSDKETNKDDSSQDISEKISESPKEKKDAIKGGYCECCKVRFTSIKQHLKGDQHRAYATNKTNYTELDAIISRGNSFDQFLAEVVRSAESESTDDTKSNLISPRALDHDGGCTLKDNAVRSEKVATDVFENKKFDDSRNRHEFDQLQPDAVDQFKKRAASKEMRPERFNHNTVPVQMNFESNHDLNEPLSGCKQEEADAGYNKPEPVDKHKREDVCEHNIRGTVCDLNNPVALSAMHQNEAEYDYEQNEPNVDHNKKMIICDLNKDNDNCNLSKPEALYNQNKSEVELNPREPDATCDQMKYESLSQQSKPQDDSDRNTGDPICNQNQPNAVDLNQNRDDRDKNKPRANRINSNPEIVLNQSQPVAESRRNPPDAVCDQDKPDDLLYQTQNEAVSAENKPNVVNSNIKLPAIFDQSNLELDSEAADGENQNDVDCDKYQPEAGCAQDQLDSTCGHSLTAAIRDQNQVKADFTQNQPVAVCDKNQSEADDAQNRLDASCDHNPTAAICDQNQVKADCTQNQPVAVCDKNQSEADYAENRLDITCDNNRPEADVDGILNKTDAHCSQNQPVVDCGQNQPVAVCDKNQLEADYAQNRLYPTCDNTHPAADKDGILNKLDACCSQNQDVVDCGQNQRVALYDEVTSQAASKQNEEDAACNQSQCESAFFSQSIAEADCADKVKSKIDCGEIKLTNEWDEMDQDVFLGESVTISESNPEDKTFKSDVQESSVNETSEVAHGTLVAENEVKLRKRRKRIDLSSSPKSEAKEEDDYVEGRGIRCRTRKDGVGNLYKTMSEKTDKGKFCKGQQDQTSLSENLKMSPFDGCIGSANHRFNLRSKRRKTDSDIDTNDAIDNDGSCYMTKECFTEKTKNRKLRCISDSDSSVWFPEEIYESPAVDTRKRFSRRLRSAKQVCDERQNTNMRRKLRSRGQRDLEPSITFVDYALDENEDDDNVSNTRQSTMPFTRSSLQTSADENSSYYSPLKRLRNEKISRGSRKTGSDNQYPTRSLDKDNLDLQDDMELDHVATAGTTSGSSTQSDEEKPVDDCVTEDPKFSGSSTIDFQYPDVTTNGSHDKLTMKVLEERASGIEDSQFTVYSPRRHGKVTAPTDILISQPKRSPDLPPRRNADKSGPLQFTPDKGSECSSPESALKCRNKIEDILCTLKSPKEDVNSRENSVNFKCKKTLAMPNKAGFEEEGNKENDSGNLNIDHTPKKRKYSRGKILESSPRHSEPTSTVEDPESLMKHNPSALSGSEYLPNCDDLNNVGSGIKIPDNKLSNSESCSSVFGDTNDVFYDDHQKGISLHERVKTRKRQASLLAGAKCSEHLTTPTKKRSTPSKKGGKLRIRKARSESGVCESSNNVDAERFRLVSVNEDERLAHSVAVDPSVLVSTPAIPRIKSRKECSESGGTEPNTDVHDEQFNVVSANADVPSILASTPALLRAKTNPTSSLEKPEESNNSVIRRTSPRKAKQTVATSQEKHKESPIVANDTSVNTQSANSSLLADSSSSLNTSNTIALSITSALLSSKRVQSKKKSKSTVSSKNRLTLGTKKSSTKNTLSKLSKRKAQKNFEFSDDGYDFDF